MRNNNQPHRAYVVARITTDQQTGAFELRETLSF